MSVSHVSVPFNFTHFLIKCPLFFKKKKKKVSNSGDPQLAMGQSKALFFIFVLKKWGILTKKCEIERS
jgi:hypothetical protein